MRIARHALVLALGVIGASGCGGSTPDDRSGPAPTEARTLRVPSAYKTIQAAVEASRPGDLVLVSPGEYQEAVTVADEHPRIVIRGTDRSRAILDGDNGRLPSGITVQADGVAVENLTIRRYAVNGLVFAPGTYEGSSPRDLRGWRGSYITAYDNGLYGVYAFQALRGSFDHVYASGHPDSGIYVGQCRRCDAVVRDSVMENNNVGFEDTNASGVTVTATTSRGNRIGALLNSTLKEKLPPQGDVRYVGNRILDNNNRRAPTGDSGFGSGFVIAGGHDNVVERNLVRGHEGAGIVVVDAAQRSGGYPATNNTIRRNRLQDNATDLALLTSRRSNGNCFEGNRPGRTVPARLEQMSPCGRSVPIRGNALRLPSNPPAPRRGAEQPAPPPQPEMPDAQSAPPRPATGPAPAVDLAGVRTPAR